MIWFLHGKNEIQIQENMQKILKSSDYSEKIEIPAENTEPQYFADIVCTPNIFSPKNLVLVPLEKASEELSLKYIEISQNKAEDTDVLFYLQKNVSAKSKILPELKKLKEVKIIEVKDEKDWTIFNFADAVFDKNRKKAYELLKTLELKEENSVAIHAVLTNHLKNLARIVFNAEIKVAPFVKTKLQRQAKNFSNNDILNLYKFFYKVDKDLKTGGIRENVANVLTIEKVFEPSKDYDAKEDIHKR